jgi:hypothetical protein
LPRWKATEQLLSLAKDGEVFDDNWMNFDRIAQYAPPSPEWGEKRPLRMEDVDIWEVITEMSGPVGVYAAWCPYGECYLVTRGWGVMEEFTGPGANDRLEAYLIEHHIPYPKAA